MKFVLDGMLGKLARWLRMMGHDATYSNSFDDEELLSVAKAENRILLTRDFALYQQATSKNIETYYVEGNTETERLAELSLRFNLPLKIDLEKSRCPKCGTQLEYVAKAQIESEVEQNTLLYYDTFWKCSKCGKVYWQGAHWSKIRATLEKATQMLERKKGLKQP